MEPDISKNEQVNLKAPELYINRELSWIEFNKRVVYESEDKIHPLLERLKFLSIFSSNLDEFFMIRVAGLKRQISEGVVELSTDGMTPQQQLNEVRQRIMPLYKKQEALLNDDILPALEQEGIFIHRLDNLSDEDITFLKLYFCDSVLPALTPLTLDPAHPFPRIINCSLNIAFVVEDHTKKNIDYKIAFLQLPAILPRFVPLKRESGYHFVLMEQVIKLNMEMLFPGLKIVTSNTFRVTRDADIEIAEDEAEDLLTEIAEQIKHRKWGTAAVRLEISTNMPAYLTNVLKESLEIDDEDVYIVNRPLKLSDFMQLLKLEIRHLKDIPFLTRDLPEFHNGSATVFDAIKKKDLMVKHPFDSFTNNVLKFFSDAVNDEDVVAIKITLYRTGLNSPIVALLKKAAELGKEVTAFVELKARFDEENNITWAKELEQIGVHVVYGVLGLKTHCKIAMVVRNENNKLKTYLHLSTGNYNQITSRIYTDIGIFTAREEFVMDAIHLFNYLTGYSHHKAWNHFLVAPINLRQQLIKLIERETELHTPEEPGLIFAKMNALAHDEVIQALYRASQKGVKIKLLVRGICCLKPGIPNVSENIEVKSILGRFLEHSRIFLFKNAGKNDIYLSSADWMTRNLHRRVELMFPILDEGIKKHLTEILNLYWKDNTKSWLLNSDGQYEKISPVDSKEQYNSQQHFIDETKKIRKKLRQTIFSKRM